MAGFNKDKFKTGTDEWETPSNIFDPLNDEFKFTLDVAATKENSKCKKYITKDVDALKEDWGGEVCWMNPPFGRDLKKFVIKAYTESLKGCVVVCLIPAKTNTIWWHDYVMRGEVRFIRGRPKFSNYKHGYPFPMAIVIFRGK